MQESLFAELFAPLECALLELAADGRWSIASRAPRWLVDNANLQDERDDPKFSRAAAPPFLANFLARAEAHWARGERSTLRSNAWIELGRDGSEWSLRAAAVALESGRRAVFVERVDPQIALGVLFDGELAAPKRKSPLHDVVHDLKSPLAGILGSLSLLAGDRALSDEQREIAEIGLESVRKQELLIRRLLEKPASELASGDVRTTADLCDAVRSIVDVYAEVARLRGVELSSAGIRARTTPLFVVAHRGRLERVLANLVEHALERSPNAGRVAIEFEERADSVLVVVDDAGPKISDAERARWFDELAILGESHGGARVALAWCKHSLAAWGGEIDSVALDPSGSSVRVRLRKTE